MLGGNVCILALYRLEKVIKVLTIFGFPFFLLYLFSMVIYPWIKGNGNWLYVHSVWMDWQALNVGVIAFLSSIIAFYISKYHDNQQRERESNAARSFLPEALSELCSYFKSSSKILIEAYSRLKDNTMKVTPLENKVPELPKNYREIFSRCISLAKPDIAQYLSNILMRLQIHHARIVDLVENAHPDTEGLILKKNIILRIYCLAELQAFVTKIFNFARGLEEFNNNPLNWEDFENAYGNLRIRVDEFDNLANFTERKIKSR